MALLSMHFIAGGKGLEKEKKKERERKPLVFLEINRECGEPKSEKHFLSTVDTTNAA